MNRLTALAGDTVVDAWLVRHRQYVLRFLWFLQGLLIPLAILVFVVEHLDDVFLQSLWRLS